VAFFGLVDVGAKRLTTRFILSEVIEKEILSEYAYDIFEPTLKLEIQRRDVLKDIGLDGIKRVVVMHFMESALRMTKGMLDDLAKAATSEYTYWFLGTGFGLRPRGQFWVSSQISHARHDHRERLGACNRFVFHRVDRVAASSESRVERHPEQSREST